MTQFLVKAKVFGIKIFALTLNIDNFLKKMYILKVITIERRSKINKKQDFSFGMHFCQHENMKEMSIHRMASCRTCTMGASAEVIARQGLPHAL